MWFILVGMKMKEIWEWSKYLLNGMTTALNIFAILQKSDSEIYVLCDFSGLYADSFQRFKEEK